MRPALAVVVLLAGAGAAEEPAPAVFSEGLERLAALGLPPMKDAEWVKVPAGSPIENFSQSYEFREMRVKLGGGAWKLPGEPGQMLGFGTAEQIAGPSAGAKKTGEPEAPEELTLFQKALRNYAASKEKEGGAPAPPPKPKPDLAEADAKLMTDALAKDEVRKELAEQMGYSRYVLPGRLLIFCAQLHAAGKTGPANRLAAAVFDLAPDKAAVVDAAVSHFAEKEYEKATRAFFEKQDWAAYEAALKGLLAKYPRGWEQAGAVAMLMGPLEKRAKGVKPPVPSLPQIELKPEALSALEEMLEPPDTASIPDEELARANGVDLSEVPEQHRARYVAMLRQGGMGRGNRSAGIWLLSKPAAGKDPAAKLKSMGMDGLIALAAAATDGTLIPVPRESDGSTYYSYGSNRSPEDTARETFSRMMRPSTRGELAISLLEEVVPADESGSDEADAETMQALAVDFWKQHRQKSAVELAGVYLSGGSRSQRAMAGQFLAIDSDPAAHAAFEKAVLSSGEPADFCALVETYLDTRKEAGKPFFDAYAKQLREALPEASADGDDDEWGDSGGAYMIKAAGGVEKYLKKLSLKVGGVPLKRLLEEALKAAPTEGEEGEEGKDSPLAALSDAIAKLPLPEALSLIGGAAPEASTPQLMELYGIVLKSIYSRRSEGRGTAPAEKVTLPPELIALWRPLLAKTEELPGKSEFVTWARSCGARTVGDATFLLMEVSAFPASGYAFRTFAGIGSPDALLPFVKARVEAWSTGKEPPAWPDPEKVTAERRAEIEGKLAALPVKEVLPFVTALSTEEKLWISDLVTEYGTDKEAPAALVELGQTVIDLKPYQDSMPHDAALLEKLGIGSGWRIDAALLEKLAARMAGEAKELSGSALLFYQAPMGIGVIATASKKTDGEEEPIFGQRFQHFAYTFEEHDDPAAMVWLSVNGASDYWKVVDGKVTKQESLDADRSALKTLASERESKRIRPPYIQVIVLTLEDARKFLEEP
jgi:hypothetical protein